MESLPVNKDSELYRIDFKSKTIQNNRNGSKNGSKGKISKNVVKQSSNGEKEEDTDSSEELRNFFTATRSGFKQKAGEVKRVTRRDFEDYHRRRHLESFARSMDQWNEFESRIEYRGGATPQDFTFKNLNFDRYRDILLRVDVKNLSKLDQFLLDLMESYCENMENEDLNLVMSKLRRKYKIAPSKRDIFERLECLEEVTIDQNEKIELKEESVNKQEVSNGSIVGNKDNVKEKNKKEKETYQKVVVGSKFRHMLRNKAIRSNSGVVVITVMTSPGTFSCSENCYYCPNEPGQPRSYLSTEPAVLRANQNDFDAVKQFYDRANTLYKNGHIIDKIEIIVLGGTWSGYPREYQEEFIRDLFYAANVYPEKINQSREKKTIEEEHKINEKSKCRIIGLTLETRPDRINASEIKLLRRFGCTRVQLGVQHTKDEILDYVNRGHKNEDSVRAIHLLKENCFKVDIHIMPDLPGSDPEEDIKMFKYILSSEEMQVDQWKIYPCEVTPFSEIEKWYKQGKFVPYFDVDANLLTNLIMRVKRAVHPWIRLNRVIRDIPNPSIIGGNNLTNMRQLILNKMKKLGIRCKCIRCREVKETNVSEPELVIRQYETIGGTEYFISYENEERTIIYGFLRLRISDRETYDEKISKFKCLTKAGLIRELHVYGIVVAHGEKLGVNQPSQHRGLGSNLILMAEIISAYRGLSTVAIIAGIGTREYYRKHGYEVEETFMTKRLSWEDMERRYEESQKREVKIPKKIQIEVNDLNNSRIILENDLPVSKEELVEPELVENEKYNIEVEKILRFAKYKGNEELDYSRMSKMEEIKLGAGVLGQRVKEILRENAVAVAVLSVYGLTVAGTRGVKG